VHSAHSTHESHSSGSTTHSSGSSKSGQSSATPSSSGSPSSPSSSGANCAKTLSVSQSRQIQLARKMSFSRPPVKAGARRPSMHSPPGSSASSQCLLQVQQAQKTQKTQQGTQTQIRRRHQAAGRNMHGSPGGGRCGTGAAVGGEQLLLLASKFHFVYKECILLVRKLGLDTTISLQVGSYPKFAALLGAAISSKQHFPESAAQKKYLEQYAGPLLAALVTCMTDLRTLIGTLDLSPAVLQSGVEPEVLRLAYFTIYSLFIELVNMHRILSPQMRILHRRSHSSKQQIKGSPFAALARSKSMSLRKKSATVSSTSFHSRVPSVQGAKQQTQFTVGGLLRPPLKIDTEIGPVRRQDSDQSSTGNFSDGAMPNSASVSSAVDSAPTNLQGVGLINDTKLYELISHTIQSAQVVFSQLNTAIAKSASSTAKKNDSEDQGKPAELDHVGQKVKEMTVHCVASMDQTKRISATLRVVQTMDHTDDESQKRLYEETNLFLKSIINVLAATKGAIHDIPALNEVRGALSNLTRATKELTICLETSTLKKTVMNNTSSGSNLVEQPSLSSIPSMTNFQYLTGQQQHRSRTPLRTSKPQITQIATLGRSSPVPPPSSAILSPRSLAKKTQAEVKDSVSMQQHILDMKAASSMHAERSPMKTPLTTPLAASIGPAAASAVLPNATNAQSTAMNAHDLERNPFDRQMGNAK